MVGADLKSFELGQNIIKMSEVNEILGQFVRHIAP